MFLFEMWTFQTRDKYLILLKVVFISHPAGSQARTMILSLTSPRGDVYYKSKLCLRWDWRSQTVFRAVQVLFSDYGVGWQMLEMSCGGHNEEARVFRRTAHVEANPIPACLCLNLSSTFRHTFPLLPLTEWALVCLYLNCISWLNTQKTILFCQLSTPEELSGVSDECFMVYEQGTTLAESD